MIGERPATRSSRGRGRAPDDPDEREKQLKAQLRAMSMYASHTSGDGNCLFRALSDQLYGFPSHYATLRHEICDYLEAAPERFAGFVDIEKPFDEYIRTMRQNGTYGGHLELSAFASLKRKEIKIVQPGLVYVVTGDDDSSEAVAERLALEERRRKIQSRIPPGTEGPPPSARDSRRKKRIDRRSKSRGLEAVNGGARAGSSRLTAEPEGDAEDGEDDVDDDLQHLTGPIEAYGPLYIAYHNWEHYSSIRNLTGPHTGLPRIIERNVSLAAQQQVTNASPSKRTQHDDNEISTNPKPTEHEELILRSVPGHTLSEVRVLLKQHGNLWETVVEVLIAKDAAEAEREGSEGRLVASSPPGTTTRSRGASYSLGFGNVSSNGYRKDSQTASPSVEPRNGVASPSQHHSGLLGKKLHSRPSSRSEMSSEVANASASRASHKSDLAGRVVASAGALPQVPVKTPFSPSVKFERNEASPSAIPSSSLASSSSQPPGMVLPLPLPVSSSGLPSKKRAAPKEAGHLDGNGVDRASPRPRRRSTSRERDEEEEEEMSVDGALAADFAAHTKTSSSGEESGTRNSSASATEPARSEVSPATKDGLHKSTTSFVPIEPIEKQSSLAQAPLPLAADTGTGSMAASAATLRGKTLTDNVNSTYSSSASSPRSSLCPTSDSTPLSTTAPPSNPVEPASPFAEEEEEFNVSDLATAPSKTYTYSLQTSRNRLLSPPVSPRLLAARREEGNLSAKEKREIELKRKRDRQRERRAQAKRGKGGKSASGASAFGATTAGGVEGADDSGSEWEPGKGNSNGTGSGGKRGGRGKGKVARGRAKLVKSSRPAAEPKSRKKRGDDEYDTTGEAPSSGFVELKI